MAAIEPDPELALGQEVADDGADADSSLGTDAASSTQSLNSSVYEYRIENGRTYHKYKDGKYNLPNDEREIDRLDLQHHLFLLTLANKLGLAPPNEVTSRVQRVLDVGTGTGIWAIDFGDEHPEAEVTGVDLSPTQPEFVPANVRFLIDDIDEEWNYPAPFDYIHSRMMNSSVKNWHDYAQNIFNNLAPEGYAEFLEIDIFIKSDDGTLQEHHRLSKWCKLLSEASVKLQRPYHEPARLKDILTNIGFDDVVITPFKWPLNPWARDPKFKTLGLWSNTNTNDALEAITMAPFTRALGWTKDEVNAFLVDVRRELNDPRIHAYWPIYSVYGKRPFA